MPAPDKAPSAQPGVIVDPYRAYNFKLIDQGLMQAAFTRVEGLAIIVNRALFRAGGENSAVRAIPMQVSYPPVKLWYGVTDSDELLRWLFTAVKGRVERRDVSLALLNEAGTDHVRRWDFFGAWPCEWHGTPLDALGDELAIESLTLAFDRLELADDGNQAP
jgi:phage tail-like protein